MTEEDEDEGGRCVKCGGPNTRNPHPDAGKLDKLMEVGAMWECLPCCFGRSMRARKRASQAERETDKLRESVRRLVGEWRQLSMDDQLPNNFLRGVDKCADELTAFLAENKEN